MSAAMIFLGCAVALMVGSQGAGEALERQYARSNPTVEISGTVYKGTPALRVVDARAPNGLDPLVMLPTTAFRDGTIEVEVAGLPLAGAGEGARGFIGIAFRVQRDPRRYEAFYVRPTNGRANEQIRRNHATQYISEPEYPWYRLRKESPGVYESYADMVAGAWTRLRIEVEGATARLYVNGAQQPSLIVNDLKLGPDAAGGIALWVGPGTEGYFANVRVTPRAN